MKKQLTKIGPGILGSLFTGSGGWDLRFDGEAITFAKGGQGPISISLNAVTAAVATSGTIWAEIRITSPTQSIACDGVTNEKAERYVEALRAAVGQALLLTIAQHKATLKQLADELNRLLSRPKYLSNRDLEVWISKRASGGQASTELVLELVGNPMLPREGAAEELRQHVDLLTDTLLGPRILVAARNERFVKAEIARHKTFFDSVEKTPLTHEQRLASVVMEDRNLLVAAAGSGKTSTVVGKIGYSLLTKLYAPEDFLVLAFNNDAAKELDGRINEQLRAMLPKGKRIQAKTFHALGIGIMAVAAGKKPSIANFAGGSELTDSNHMEQLIQQEMAVDKEFAADWVMFRAVCLKAAKNPADFDTVDEWDRFVRANGEYQNGKRGFLTINGEIVKSQGELAIANWLFMQGVDYEYERPYEHDTASAQYRQYRPDFYLSAVSTYLEHYALDKQGNPPAAFGPKYKESMEWKSRLHNDKGTALITTTFAEFVSGALFSRLKAELLQRGQKLAPRPTADVLARLNENQKTDYGSLLRTFLKHAKSNQLDEAAVRARAGSTPHPYRAQLFLRVFWKLMAAYEAKLRKASEIDFEDMIIAAARDVTDRRYQHSYKLILVDEFQDISQARAKLLKALLAQSSDCKLFAVGDDWQSIYRFAGSDIDAFTNFPKHFGVTATNFLTQTFRSNQGISDVASRFIQKNQSQLRKRIDAQDKTKNGVVIVRRYDNSEALSSECEACLAEVSANRTKSSKRASVYILARYRHQRPGAFEEWQDRFKASLEITFKTIHSSKGLQADHVIILGMTTGRYAFPSEISDDPLLHLVMPEAELFPNSEERRLFYVAMTRARHSVYLLGHSFYPSAFLTELVDDDGLQGILRHDQIANMAAEFGRAAAASQLATCPKCNKGRLRKRNGKFGEFFGCSNFPSCKYTRNVADGSRT